MSSLQTLLIRCSTLAKYQGCFPFNISENGEVTVSKRWLIFSIVMHATQIFGAYYLAFNYIFVIPFQNRISEWLYLGQVVAFQGSSEIHLIWILFNKKHLNKAFKYLVEISKEVSFSGKLNIWYQHVLPFCLLILLLLQFLINNLTESMQWSIGDLYGIITNYFQAICNCITVIQFTNFLVIFRGVLKDITTSIREQPIWFGNNFERLLDKHDRLISACEEVNYCFGPLLLISLITYFEIVTANFYYIYYHYSVGKSIFNGGIWVFIFLELNRYLVYNTTHTIDSAKEFYHELFRVAVIENNQNENPINHISKQNVHHSFIIKRKLRITACSYFNIDYKFYCSMIATCVTYLIIFIQFHDLVENNRNNTQY